MFSSGGPNLSRTGRCARPLAFGLLMAETDSLTHERERERERGRDREREREGESPPPRLRSFCSRRCRLLPLLEAARPAPRPAQPPAATATARARAACHAFVPCSVRRAPAAHGRRIRVPLPGVCARVCAEGQRRRRRRRRRDVRRARRSSVCGCHGPRLCRLCLTAAAAGRQQAARTAGGCQALIRSKLEKRKLLQRPGGSNSAPTHRELHTFSSSQTESMNSWVVTNATAERTRRTAHSLMQHTHSHSDSHTAVEVHSLTLSLGGRKKNVRLLLPPCCFCRRRTARARAHTHTQSVRQTGERSLEEGMSVLARGLWPAT